MWVVGTIIPVYFKPKIAVKHFLMFKILKDFLMFLFLTCWVGLRDEACTGLPMELKVELDRSACGSSDGMEDVEDQESDVDLVLLIIALEFIDE